MSQALELASQCDAEGRHDDAVNALAAAARDNDFVAMTELASRLIIGDRAPFLPKDGAKLMSDAARSGNADATIRLAVMTALGAHVEQSWDKALAMLVHAAKLGSSSAQGQLRVLAGQDVHSGSDDWLQLARSIDIAAWLKPVQGRIINDAPRIEHYSNFVSPAICAWIMDHMRPYLQPAKIYSADHHGHVADQMRTNSIGPLHLACIDLVNVLLQYRIAAVTRIPVSNFDGPTALHYKVGEEIKDHYDYINPDIPNYEHEIQTRGERLITFLTYLNDDYDGGETAFSQLNLSHKGATGEGLLFVNVLNDGKPDGRSVHAGRPPTRGEKWLLSQFLRTHPVFNTPAESLY
jgi:prolyl 4-hydroxylase